MRKILLSLFVTLSCGSLLSHADEIRSGNRERTDTAVSEIYGQAPLAVAVTRDKAPEKAAAKAKVLPATGSFIDDPNLPYLMGFAFTYPYGIYQLDYPEMTETAIIDEGLQFPTSVHLREGNFEGTAFSDNPGGSYVMQGSFDVSGNKNWQYARFVAKDNICERPMRMAYDEREDRYYALSQLEFDKKETYCFISLSPYNLSDVKVIKKDLPGSAYCSALTWDPRDGSIVGVSVTGDVIRFDKKTGAAKVIFNNGLPQDHVFFGGLVYSPRHSAFIWAYLRTEGGYTAAQDFYLIDTKKKTCELLKSVPKSEAGLKQMSSLMVNEQYVNQQAPRPAELTADKFAAHATSGTMEFKVPELQENGNEIYGNVRLVVRVSGMTNEEGTKTVLDATYKPGDTATVSFSNLSEGLHRISVYAVSSGDIWSRRLNVNKLIGYDTPLAPENVVLTAEKLTWDAATTGMKGTDIAADGIEYEVWVDAEMIGTTTDTSFPMNFDKTELLSHLAAVAAINHGHKSELAYSDRLTTGEYRTIPAHFVPGASDVLLSTVINGDADNRTWGYNESYESWSKPAAFNGGENNDWLFLPKLNFDDPEALYEISFEYRTANVENGNGIELFIADKPEPENATSLLRHKANTNNSFVTVSTVTNASGIRYLGFRPFDQTMEVYVRNVKVVKNGGDIHCPAAISDLNVIPGAEGSTSSTLEFTAPSLAVDGNALPANSTISFTLEGENVYGQTFTAVAGEKVSRQFVAKNGITIIKVTPSLDSKPGLPASHKFFSGEDVPGNVKDLQVTLGDNPNEVHISFKSPEHEGYNGGWSSTDDLKYYVMIKRPGASKWSRTDAVDYTEILFTINEGFPQEYIEWGIMTENKKGSSNKWNSTSITCGPAFTLPMRETMADGSPVYSPIITDDPTEEYIGSAGFADPSQIKKEYAVPNGRVIGIMPPADELPGKARVVLPYFSTKDVKNPAVTMRVLLDPEVVAQAELYATAYGMEPVKIGEWSDKTEGHGFTSLYFALPDKFKNKSWVQLFVDATFEGGPTRRYVAIERYTVAETRTNDFSIISAVTPAGMRVNREATLRAAVCNHSKGSLTAPELSLKYTDAAGIVTEKTLKPADADQLGPDEEAEYVYSFTPTADMLGEMKFEFTLPDDEIVSNNSYSATGEVQIGDAVMASVLKAERRKDDPATVDLEWDEPVIFGGTDSFEDLLSFSIDEKLGAFINIDMDGRLTYDWENWTFPHADEPHGFIVFDDSYSAIPVGSRGPLAAHTGHKYLMALSPMDYVTASDWLISPEVEPGSDVSFWLGSISVDYGPDQVGVYYSTGSTDPNDFEMVTYKRKTTTDWEEISCTLPDNARRFAIKYYSNDCFGIKIDDISYVPAGGLMTLEGFEVVRNGEKVAELQGAKFDHVDTEVSLGQEHAYYVVPLLMNGDGIPAKGEMSPTAKVPAVSSVAGIANDVTIRVAGNVIEVRGVDKSEVTVAAENGILIPAECASAETLRYRVDSGVYIVSTPQRKEKIFIR